MALRGVHAGRGVDRPRALGRRPATPRQAVERAVAMKLMANHPLRLVRLAEAHVMAGRPENASLLAVKAIDLAQEQRERGHEAYALKLLGDVWAIRDDPDGDRAEEHYRKALALAVQLGMRPLQG